MHFVIKKATDISAPTKATLVVFAISFFVFLANLPRDVQKDIKDRGFRNTMTSADQVPGTFLPYLILHKHTLLFDSIIKTTRTFDGNHTRPYFLNETSKGYVSAYPITTGLLATPFFAAPVWFNKIPELTTYKNILKLFVLGRVSACFYAAASVSLFYLILRTFSKNKNPKWVTIFTVFYALGTATWSISSRGMWQHTPSQFVISLAVLFLIQALQKPKLLRFVGFILGVAVLIRPTNIILALIVGAYVLFTNKKHFKYFVLGAIPPAIFLGSYNHLTYGSIFFEGYGSRNDMDWSTPITTSLLGYAISPARSFLFISPPLVFAYYTIYKLFQKKQFCENYNTLLRYLSIGFLGTLLLFSKWYTWDGGNGFGYRMISDCLPIIGLLAFATIQKLKGGSKLLIMILIIYSVWIHANAVFNEKSRCSSVDNWNFKCLPYLL